MARLFARAPHPALSEHAEFAMMLTVTMERYRVSLAEIREDYWLIRAWRALVGDPSLAGRVARIGVANLLITGARFGPAPVTPGARARLRRRAVARLRLDTGRTPDALGMAVQFADGPGTVGEIRVRSVLAQTVAGDPRWADLTPYAADLAPVLVSVAQAVGTIVAA